MGGIVDGAQRVAANRAQLNGIATDFANTVNANQLAGQDLAGATGTAMFTVGTAPTDLSVALTSGSQIAAAAPGGGARDATNLANLETARQSKGFEASLAGQITDNATALKQKNTIAAAQTSILSGAQTALSSASGVNLDSEAVDLMRFQQAYSASSRIIQVARETMQSILDIR
jgi:flagellar hook-associated protein 1